MIRWILIVGLSALLATSILATRDAEGRANDAVGLAAWDAIQWRIAQKELEAQQAVNAQLQQEQRAKDAQISQLQEQLWWAQRAENNLKVIQATADIPHLIAEDEYDASIHQYYLDHPEAQNQWTGDSAVQRRWIQVRQGTLKILRLLQ